MTIILMPVTFFVLLSVGLLLIRVLINTSRGYTQIESWEEERLTSAKRRGLISRTAVFPYDLGLYENFVNTLGPIYTWPLPWGRPPVIARAKALNTAVRFERNENGYDQHGNPMTWPPDMKNVDPPQEYIQGNLTNVGGSSTNNNINDYSQSTTSSQTLEPNALQNQARDLENNQTNNFELSSIQNVQHNTNSNENTQPLPSTLSHTVPSDNDFYSREHWATFEGEKLSDFGVDLDSEMDLTYYAMSQININTHTPRCINRNSQVSLDNDLASRFETHPNHHPSNTPPPPPLRFGHLHTNPASATHTVYNPAAQATNPNTFLTLYEPNGPAMGSTSSAALSRSSSPLLRHAASLSNSNIYVPTDHELVSLASKDGPPLQASQTDTEPIGQPHGDAPYYLTAKLGNGPNTSVLENSTSLGPFNVASGPNNLNEDDLPLAKLLAIRRQEKIRQKDV